MNLDEATENEKIKVDEGDYVLFKIAIKAEDAEDFMEGLAYSEKQPGHQHFEEEEETDDTHTLARRRGLELMMSEANQGIMTIKTQEAKDALTEAQSNVNKVELI